MFITIFPGLNRVVLTLTFLLSSAQLFALESNTASLKLSKNVYIEKDWARVFIQFGKVVKQKQLDKFEPFCSLEVNEVARAERSVMVVADVFTITKIHNRHPQGLGIFPVFKRQEDDPTPVDLEVDIFLSSDSQPQVLRIRCVKTLYDPWPAEITWQEVYKVLHPLIVPG